jgi:hypothetical protein
MAYFKLFSAHSPEEPQEHKKDILGSMVSQPRL